jgi:ribosome-binding protein aMBF1 (putative translation factor)
MKSYSKIKEELLKDKKTHEAYEKLDAEFMLAQAIIKKRLSKGLTQASLAKKMGTKQSAIARVESGNYNPSIAFLEKIAKALDTKVVVSFS